MIHHTLSRREFLEAAAAVGGGTLLGCNQPTARPPAQIVTGLDAGPNGEAWERVLAAARAEGVVNVYGGSGSNNRDAEVEPFERAFPGIKMNGLFGPGRDLVNRVVAERTANKKIPDVMVGPGASGIFILKPIGALPPLEPALILPEVTDTSKWLNNRLWFVDADPPNTTIGFVGSVQGTTYYNPDLVDPKEFTSYLDLLNPKWKGKIVATDVRLAGGGAAPSRFWYTHPDLGPSYLERLFGEMDVTIGRDQRQMIDWVAQGRYPIGILFSSTDVRQAIDDGLPIAAVDPHQFREGAPMSTGGGAISLVEGGPNPNAAKVFVNWLLSRDGQLNWQKYIKAPSLRNDINRDDVPPDSIPKLGLNYLDVSNEHYAALSADEISPLLDRIFERTGR
ncbi:MAG: ABC-type Fe3+ transport system periplasmic component [Chloroflexi bacterium]|nr:ABC-type Fe3+ transport system periplasmic component [Chloroflexota bacterium]